MRTVCIIQARLGSTRLPGKVLEPVGGRPMLWRVVERVRRCRLVDEVVVATTTLAHDDQLANYCHSAGWAVSRGSAEDVLDRYYHAAQQFDAGHVVRVTSDCPLLEPSVTDYVIAAYHSAAPPVDYASNCLQRTYPRGLDTEVFSRAALERAWHEDKSAAWREHVTPYINRQPDKFRLLDVTNPDDFSQHRWTVDTPDDLELVRRIYAHFDDSAFGWREVLELLAQKPEWLALNRHVQQKAV